MKIETQTWNACGKIVIIYVEILKCEKIFAHITLWQTWLPTISHLACTWCGTRHICHISFSNMSQPNAHNFFGQVIAISPWIATPMVDYLWQIKHISSRQLQKITTWCSSKVDILKLQDPLS
jgi:hypothetical protein